MKYIKVASGARLPAFNGGKYLPESRAWAAGIRGQRPGTDTTWAVGFGSHRPSVPNRRSTTQLRGEPLNFKEIQKGCRMVKESSCSRIQFMPQ
ncbi:unnamed protein product [Victoria cruziana]